jgi:hypothetical protein
MEKIPTAEELFATMHPQDGLLPEWAKEFAISLTKLHVEAALNAVSKEEIHFSYSGKLVTGYILEKDSIIKAYPLDLIK